MKSLEFLISTDNHLTIVQLKGKILFEAELETLNHEFLELNATEGMNWILDLSELTHTNSTGIGFLVRTLTRSRVNNGELVLCGVKGNVEKLFEIAKINEIFNIYTNVSEAKQHFNK